MYIYVPYEFYNVCRYTNAQCHIGQIITGQFIDPRSVSSTEYLSVTNYTVYWSGPSAETSKTNSTSYSSYTIKGLHSNSPYSVAVEAIDPLGRQNSTNQLYFTSPTG